MPCLVNNGSVEKEGRDGKKVERKDGGMRKQPDGRGAS